MMRGRKTADATAKLLKSQGKSMARQLIENQLPTPRHPAADPHPPCLSGPMRAPRDPRGGLDPQHSLPLCVRPSHVFGPEVQK